MNSEITPLISSTPPRGTYCPTRPDDIRSPCPAVNALANHGYIPRNGRNVLANELNSALLVIGLSRALSAVFTYPLYEERIDPSQPGKKLNLLQKLVKFLRDPWSLLAVFGFWKQNMIDENGRRVIDLDQLATHAVIEHDVSLTRRDYLQKEGNSKIQDDLIKQLMACTSDGKNITIEDLAALRRRRLQQQLNDNPDVNYGQLAHDVACGETSLVLGVFGDGKTVPCDYIKAFFKEERLPSEEGWKRRWWWTLGLLEFKRVADKVKDFVGITIAAEN